MERFWNKVDKNGPDTSGLGQCWLWTACRSKGYGKFDLQKGQSPRGAHRVAYELLVGPIPAGLDLITFAAFGIALIRRTLSRSLVRSIFSAARRA